MVIDSLIGGGVPFPVLIRVVGAAAGPGHDLGPIGVTASQNTEALPVAIDQLLPACRIGVAPVPELITALAAVPDSGVVVCDADTPARSAAVVDVIAPRLKGGVNPNADITLVANRGYSRIDQSRTNLEPMTR